MYDGYNFSICKHIGTACLTACVPMCVYPHSPKYLILVKCMCGAHVIFWAQLRIRGT